MSATGEPGGLRVALIGAGGISAEHVIGWQAAGATVRVLERSGAAQLAARFDVDVVTDLDELYARSDVALIATPTATHRELALQAFAAGLDVVCEKPLGTGTEDALAIATAARAAGRRIYPAHVVRYFTAYERAKSSVVAGELGDLRTLSFSRRGTAPTSPWFFDVARGGGLIRDLMIHDLDQARWIAGEVVHVDATQTPPTRDGLVPHPVRAEVTLTHESGAVSRIVGEWGEPDVEFRTTYAIDGSRGVLTHDSADDAEPVSPYIAQAREFASGLRGRLLPRVSAVDGVIAVALAEAATDAAASGRSVAFTPPGG